MDNTRVFRMAFASVYPHYVTKAEKKGRTKEEVHAVIHWLTGYDEQRCQADRQQDRLQDFLRRGTPDEPERVDDHRRDLRLSRGGDRGYPIVLAASHGSTSSSSMTWGGHASDRSAVCW